MRGHTYSSNIKLSVIARGHIIHVQQILASLAILQESTPEHLDHIINRCYTKIKIHSNYRKIRNH